MTRRCHPADETPHEVVLDPAITKLLAAMSTPPTLQQLGPHDGRAALREAQRGSTAVRAPTPNSLPARSGRAD